ncbi:MAG TPA: DUF790 family protein [Chloroflexota bacterium]|jgi:hypothetical protein|nr:DUF790 family protein [Chloroflexota bacterium]
MSFPLKDLRLTSRRQDGGERRLYPRLLRDAAVLPKIKIAVQYFESMLGRKRSELEPETLVHFFGDHKLARCTVACLGRAYRFRGPTIAECVSRTALRRLLRVGVDSPRALRLLLFDRVNAADGGFLGDETRDGRYGALERELGLRRGQLDHLLWLDADGQAILTRVGPIPAPEDVVAQHNVGVLLSLLRHAERVELDLAPLGPDERDGIARLAAANGVAARLEESRAGARLVIAGRQDALGTWARHGRRVARTVAELVERDGELVRGGAIRLALRERVGLARLTPELVEMLVGRAHGAGWHEAPAWSVERVRRAVAEARGSRPLLTLRRLPDPQAWRGGVVLPELVVDAAGRRAFVVAVRSARHAERLAQVVPPQTSGEPYLFVGDAPSLAPLRAAGHRVAPSDELDLPSVAAALREPDAAERAA